VGYANTFAEALNQVFGAGAGDAAADSRTGGTPSPAPVTPTPSTAPPSSAAPTTAPPDGGGAPDTSARDQAVSAINAALARLSDAQKAGDFAAIGQAQADLQKAVQAYQAANGQAVTAAPTG
jgi:hypothetical protein